ncbi:hypothetical protein BC937DRAFT_91411, partial [Endogone sp. FLAS-F59071]
ASPKPVENDLTTKPTTTRSTYSYESQYPSSGSSGFQQSYVPQTRVQPPVLSTPAKPASTSGVQTNTYPGFVYDSNLHCWRRVTTPRTQNSTRNDVATPQTLNSARNDVTTPRTLTYNSVATPQTLNSTDVTTPRTLYSTYNNVTTLNSTRLSYVDSDDDDVSTNIYQRRFEYGNDAYGWNSNTTSSQNFGSIHRNSQQISYGYYDSDDDYVPRYTAPIPQTPVRTQATPAYTHRATTPQATPARTRATTPQATPARTRATTPQATPARTRATTPQAAPVRSRRASKPNLSQIPDGEVMVNPQNVRYTQDSIAPTFRNGSFLKQTANDIRYGLLDPNDLPSIRVRVHKGAWYSMDNRRLWVLKEAGITNVRACNVTSDQSLEVEFSTKLTSKSGGQSIRVRRGAAAAASAPVAISVY